MADQKADQRVNQNAFGQSLPLPPEKDYLGQLVQGTLGTVGLGDSNNHYNLGGQLVSQAVAFGGPMAISGLRQRGMELIKALQESKTLDKMSWGGKLAGNPYYKGDPTVPLPAELMRALEYAQQRWPRVFGHITDITDIDALNQIQSGFGTSGASTAIFPTSKLSRLGFSPEVMKKSSTDPADTVAHELLHTADRITIPEMSARYNTENTRPGGYNANSFEIRARNQGANMAAELKQGQQTVRKKRVADLQAEKILRNRYLDK